MKWNDNLATGVEEIDSQNKELFKDIDKAIIEIIKTKNEIAKGSPLQELEDCFKKHFENQENLMRLSKYPNYVQHNYLHKKFLKDLNNYSDIMYMDSANANVNQVRIFVTQWLVKHIAMNDKNFGKYYKEHKDD